MDHLSRHRDSHHKDNMVVRLSCLYNGNSFPHKIVYSCWNSFQVIFFINPKNATWLKYHNISNSEILIASKWKYHLCHLHSTYLSQFMFGNTGRIPMQTAHFKHYVKNLPERWDVCFVPAPGQWCRPVLSAWHTVLPFYAVTHGSRDQSRSPLCQHQPSSVAPGTPGHIWWVHGTQDTPPGGQKYRIQCDAVITRSIFSQILTTGTP